MILTNDASATKAARYRVYSRQDDKKAYLRIDPETVELSWHRSWRDATGFFSILDAEQAMARAKRAEPERPMTIVTWGQGRAPGGARHA